MKKIKLNKNQQKEYDKLLNESRESYIEFCRINNLCDEYLSNIVRDKYYDKYIMLDIENEFYINRKSGNRVTTIILGDR